MSELFHLCMVKLAPGSVIEPGNWGRIIELGGWGHGQAVREMVLEGARRARFPDRPSRLACAFAFPTREDAANFQAASPAFRTSLLYRVAPVDASAPQFTANLWAASPVLNEPGKVNTPFTPDWTDAYWEGCQEAAEGVCREVLLTCGLRVIERAEHEPQP